MFLFAILLAPSCLAHFVVDLGVRFAAPEYVPAGSTSAIDVIVDGQAFDYAYGVTVEITINGARVSSADPAWRCTPSNSLIQCAAEKLSAGPHPIHLDVTVPTAASSLTARAVVASIGSSDPIDGNNTATLQSRVFDRGRCGQNPPQILAAESDLQWSEAQGATSYEIYYGIDGENPHLASRTTDTSTTIDPPGGEVAWFVRARFDGCPPIDSARSSFQSHGAPMTLAVATVWQQGFLAPYSVTVEGSSVMVSDLAARTIFAFDPANPVFVPVTLYGDIVSSPPRLDGGILVSPGDYLFVADKTTHSVRFAFPGQRYMYFAAGQPKAAGTLDGYGVSAKFDAPTAIAVDGTGNFYVTDSGSNLVRRLKYVDTEIVNGQEVARYDFKVTTFAGASGSTLFNAPAGVTVDPSGNVLVCDSGNHVIRRITPGGDVTTLAGTLGTAGHQDGAAAGALFDRPVGIAIDAFGNLYVSEEGNHDIRKIAPNGRVTTVATGFDKPGLMTITGDGSIWVPDAGNGRLLRAAPSTGERRRAVRR